jgi:hypothetical protein
LRKNTNELTTVWKERAQENLRPEKDEVSQQSGILLKDELVICDEYGTCSISTFRINLGVLHCGRNVARNGETKNA